MQFPMGNVRHKNTILCLIRNINNNIDRIVIIHKKKNSTNRHTFFVNPSATKIPQTYLVIHSLNILPSEYILRYLAFATIVLCCIFLCT